jgi:hypothetical protein
MSAEENFPEEKYSKLIYIGKLAVSIFVTAILNLFFVQGTTEKLFTYFGGSKYSSTVAWCVSTALSVVLTDVGLYYLFNKTYSSNLKDIFENLKDQHKNLKKELEDLNEKYADINETHRNLVFHLIAKSLTIYIPNWEKNYLSKCQNHFSNSDLQYMQELDTEYTTTISSLEKVNLNQAKHPEINNTFSLGES